MCEIDEDVCKVAKQYLPKLASTLIAKDEGREPRFELLFMDAAEYMKGHRNEFDVIIVDSSDPVGPAETLYSSEFYANMHAALRPGGAAAGHDQRGQRSKQDTLAQTPVVRDYSVTIRI
jgi:spermidine synthase